MTETILDAFSPGAGAVPCRLHGDHEPQPLYVELHHLVPRAWQEFWRPTTDGPYAHGLLWDNRTTPICRTGHGNVHWWIVAYMREVGDDAVGDAVRRAHAAHRDHVGDNAADRQTAELALLRYASAGGRLRDLVDVGLLGGI